MIKWVPAYDYYWQPIGSYYRKTNNKPESENEMAMSKDRIEFKLMSAENYNDQEATIQAAMLAFNIGTQEARHILKNQGKIVCRPSQFARFIVYRMQSGIRVNNIKLLDPKIIPAIEKEIVFDLSQNRAS